MAWTPVPATTGIVETLYALNQSAAGLAPGTLLIGGAVDTYRDGSHFFGAWDGQSLTSIGPTDAAGFSSGAAIHAITVWDPDGPGPQPPLIIVGGSFTMIGGVSANHVAAWDGTQWLALGDGLPATVNAMISFDPDGDGPATPLLVAGASAWDGVSWRTLGNGFNGPVYALALHDPDGDGTLPPALYACGAFTSSGLETTGSVAKWNGVSWIPAAIGSPGPTVYDLASLDLDGPGPQPPLLYAAGSLNGGAPVAILSNGAWTAPGTFSGSPTGDSLALFDPDGPGPRTPEVIVGVTGSNLQLGRTPFGGPYAWDGQRWSILGDEIAGGSILCFAWYDDDGDGPDPPALYASGDFTFAGGHTADHLARWDGERWMGLGVSTDTLKITSIASYDPDGPGPRPPMLIGIDGSFEPWRPAVRWNGSAWGSLDSTYEARQALALCVMDDDGPGPHGQRVFVGGDTQTSLVGYGDVLMYDGGPYLQGTGSGGDGVYCYALLAHDPDGPGPIPPSLYALTNGFTASLQRWDGASWTTIASVYADNGSSYPVAMSWNPNGNVPGPAELVVGAGAIRPNYRYDPPPLGGPCGFDGFRWRQLGTPSFGIVRALCSYDPDRDGPAQAQLFGGGESYYTSTEPVLKRLVGDRWINVGAGFYQTAQSGSSVTALITVDDGDPLGPQLWIGGQFNYADGHPAAKFARWRLAGPVPIITQQPQPASPCSNVPVTLTVAGTGPSLTYRWRASDITSSTRWTDIADGPVIIGGVQIGVASGCSTPSLTFAPAAGVSTSFTCVLTGGCGAAISNPAAVTVAACCGSPDFNHDGLPGTDQDIEAFFACLAGDCCPTCDSADFNADGDSGTDADIEAFFRVLAGGTC